MNDNKKTSGSIGFFDLLTIMFIGLKLTGFISWPWRWVLAPIWAPIALAIIIAVVIALLGK